MPLGVIEENENKIDEMCKSMDKLHEYVPTELVVVERTLESGEVKRMENYAMCKTLIGGDQLTVARVRGSAAARVDHQNKRDQLEDFVPVIEDWHAKQCLLTLSNRNGADSTRKFTHTFIASLCINSTSL